MRTRPLRRHWILAVGLLLFLAVWSKNAWVCDDAYINFRSLEQLHAGNGPVWNPHARVQVYTSVLWYWLQASLRLISPDLYANVLALSLACALGCLLVLRRILADDRAWLLLVLLMVGARGFMDYTSSGLENPLLFLVSALLLERYLKLMAAEPASAEAAPILRHFLWLAGGSLLVRHDAAVLWLLPVLQVGWRHRRIWPPRRWARVLVEGAAPLLLWSAFALFYYGSPWPNPAVAKLSLHAPRAALMKQGLLYLLTLRLDLVLAVVIGAGLVLAARHRGTRALALGMALHLVYLLWIGGDFMLGRMLGTVFLVSALLVARAAAARGAARVWAASAVALLLALALPLTPLTSPRSLDDDRFSQGVADERAYYFQATSLWTRLATPAEDFPATEWLEQGRIAARRDRRVVGKANVGFYGWAVGLEKIVIDRLGITDPFIARIPPGRLPEDWRPGHVERPLPRGYVQSLEDGDNHVEDPRQRALYEDLRLATQEPLLTPGRLGAIWRLNAP